MTCAGHLSIKFYSAVIFYLFKPIMAFTRLESSSPLLVEHYCLLCRKVLKSSNQLASPTSVENAEVLEDLFQVFSKYMGWDPPPEYKYDFRKHQFPFCGVCNFILIRIYKIHEDIQTLERQIEQFVIIATGKIVDSECKIATSTGTVGLCSTALDFKEIAESSDSIRLDEQKCCFYYREKISKRFAARVQLTAEDRKQLENYERATQLKEDDMSGDLDQYDSHEGFMSSPGGSVDSEDEDPTYAQESRTIKRRKKIPTAPDSTSASSESSDDQSDTEEPDKVPQKIIPGASKHPVKSRIKELSSIEFLLDDKLTFVFQNPDWKCVSCHETRLQKNTLLLHLTSTRCSGLVSPNSVKQLQHRGFKYDKLDDGRFECRRCPFATTSKTSIKSHIDTSHYRGEGTRKKRLLVRELVKSASFTELRPGVFLVNNEHEVGFGNNEFSCNACSFRNKMKNAVIRHVFEKHAYSVKPTMGLSIQRLGPNKYKLGEFPFEAFPNEFKCSTCGHTSVTFLHMKQHIRYEHVKDMSKNVCDICGYSTFSNGNFKDHMSSHRDDRPFLCPTCGKSFKIHTTLRSHQAALHSTSPIIKSHLCEICGQKFSSKSTLTTHMKSHQNVDCNICGKTYSPIYLPRHLESHNAEKKFECKICGSKFQRQESLYTHRKSCNGDKPYSCDICGMKFTQSFSVTRHKNVAHNPEKKTRTCVMKGPRKQRRGQSLLTKKSSAAGRDKDTGNNNNNKAKDNATNGSDAVPEVTAMTGLL